MLRSNTYKRVLVTGGAGCIGIPVCRLLRESGFEVVLFDLYEQVRMADSFLPSGVETFFGSILDSSSIREAMRGCDAVIHLAAYLGVRRTEVNKLRCLDINIDGTRNVLNACVVSNIKKIVFASSSEVYGEPLINPIKETAITQGKTVYAVSKLAGEELVKAYAEEFPSLNYTILRFFNTYGPNQIAQFVIPKFVRNFLSGTSPVIYGDGTQSRSYCFSEDTGKGTVLALLNQTANKEVINIGNSKELTSLVELAKLIQEVCDPERTIAIRNKGGFLGADRDEQREINARYCDTTKAAALLDFDPEVSLREGIQRVVNHGVLSPKWATSERDYTLDDWV